MFYTPYEVCNAPPPFFLTACMVSEPRAHQENGKSLTLEEYLLKKKKKKKRKHREEDHRPKKIRHVHHRAVQTVCAGLDVGKASLADSTKQESCRRRHHHHPCRDPPYPHAPKWCHAPFLSHQEHFIRSSCLQTGTRYGRFMHEERQPNGGGAVLHAYADELARLSPSEMEGFAKEFLELAFAEKPKGAAAYALSVVHRAAAYLPDFLDYFAFNFPNTPVKVEILGKKDIETTTIGNFHSQVWCKREKKDLGGKSESQHEDQTHESDLRCQRHRKKGDFHPKQMRDASQRFDYPKQSLNEVEGI